MTHNQKQYHGGLFENEKHAAMKVNSLCDKCEIERKNPMIIIEPDKIQQVNILIIHCKGGSQLTLFVFY